MKKQDIVEELINDLQRILSQVTPELDRGTIDDIKADAEEAFEEIIEKYNLI